MAARATGGAWLSSRRRQESRRCEAPALAGRRDFPVLIERSVPVPNPIGHRTPSRTHTLRFEHRDAGAERVNDARTNNERPPTGPLREYNNR